MFDAELRHPYFSTKHAVFERNVQKLKKMPEALEDTSGKL